MDEDFYFINVYRWIIKMFSFSGASFLWTQFSFNENFVGGAYATSRFDTNLNA